MRHLPGRVTVLLEEREPYALVNAGGLHWVDAEGYLVTDRRPAGGHRPADPDGHRRARSRRPAAPSEGLAAGLALLHVLQRTSGRLAARVSEIDLARAHGPVLYLVDGIEVRLGTDGWSDRLARLDGVLGELDARGERVAVHRSPVPGSGRAHASQPGAAGRPGPVAGRRGRAAGRSGIPPLSRCRLRLAWSDADGA